MEVWIQIKYLNDACMCVFNLKNNALIAGTTSRYYKPIPRNIGS